jgi:hypothetical protein
VAVDRAGYAWSLQPPVPSSGSWSIKKLTGKLEQVIIGRISCASNVYCLASDGNGGIDQIIGGAVGPRIVLASGHNLIGPSCWSGGTPSKVTCKSVSGDGKKEFNGHMTLLK